MKQGQFESVPYDSLMHQRTHAEWQNQITRLQGKGIDVYTPSFINFLESMGRNTSRFSRTRGLIRGTEKYACCVIELTENNVHKTLKLLDVRLEPDLEVLSTNGGYLSVHTLGQHIAWALVTTIQLLFEEHSDLDSLKIYGRDDFLISMFRELVQDINVDKELPIQFSLEEQGRWLVAAMI